MSSSKSFFVVVSLHTLNTWMVIGAFAVLYSWNWKTDSALCGWLRLEADVLIWANAFEWNKSERLIIWGHLKCPLGLYMMPLTALWLVTIIINGNTDLNKKEIIKFFGSSSAALHISFIFLTVKSASCGLLFASLHLQIVIDLDIGDKPFKLVCACQSVSPPPSLLHPSLHPSILHLVAYQESIWSREAIGRRGGVLCPLTPHEAFKGRRDPTAWGDHGALYSCSIGR